MAKKSAIPIQEKSPPPEEQPPIDEKSLESDLEPIPDNMQQGGKKANILIVDNETAFRGKLNKLVTEHAGDKANVEEVHIKDALAKIKESPGKYDVILSGSHKIDYHDERVQNIINEIDKYNRENPDEPKKGIYGTCMAHQAMLYNKGGKNKDHIVDLGKYRKGNKKINISGNYGPITPGEATDYHSHRWAVKSQSQLSDLEVIAEADVEDSKKDKHKIVQIAKHKSLPYITTQGHPEKGELSKQLLYTFLEEAYQRAA